MSLLSVCDSLPNDWRTATFEPKAGQVLDASQPRVRTIAWTPSPAGAQNLAEVTVNTKLIPTLQKIIYCTEEQVGVNGLLWTNVDGTAYYRLGDVIKDQATGQYWVCVRPAFKQDDKGKSHWMCIYNSQVGNNLPEANIYSKYNQVQKYGNHTIKLPTKLKYSREHMNNLTNLVYALLNPDAYGQKVGTDTVNQHRNGLCGFDYKYHGKLYLADVNNAYYIDLTAGQHVKFVNADKKSPGVFLRPFIAF